ncbi:MAG: hypothetical protein ACTSSH_07780 [Candidatus Heimdallarchaeota archaeon]
MEEFESVIDYKKGNFFSLLGNSFVIYYKQFFKIFLISIIPEFIFFGIFRLVKFEIGNVYNDFIQATIFTIKVDFDSEFARSSFFVLLVLAIMLFIIRSSLISNITWKTAEKGKANIVWALESTVKKTREILMFTILAVVLAVFPLLLFIIAIMMQPRMPYIAWGMIFSAILIPLLFGNKISVFIPGMSKDNLHVGSALQKSWRLGSKENWVKSITMYFTLTTLCILGPYALGGYLNNISDLAYIGALMALMRGFIYPLFDIGFTMNYLHLDYQAVNNSVFRDDIIKQRQRSAELIRKGPKKNNN